MKVYVSGIIHGLEVEVGDELVEILSDDNISDGKMCETQKKLLHEVYAFCDKKNITLESVFGVCDEDGYLLYE